MALVTWLVSLRRRDVSIVDSLWSLMLLAAGVTYAFTQPEQGVRAWIMLALCTVWALRLCVHITVRNHGKGEDRRYQVIRERNQPHFELKSLYLVFGFQAVLATVVSLPLLGAVQNASPLGWIDFAGMAVVSFGITFEAVGDWQLARFKADPANAGQVMDRGLWRYTRHPNYFGECCVWWGFYLLAVEQAAWTVAGPILMTLLLLKVSGVSLLEKDIGERRPGYASYIRRTNAFIPGLPRTDR